MAFRIIFLVQSLAVVSHCAQVGLQFIQKDVILKKMLECYSVIDGETINNLSFADGTAAKKLRLLNEKTCSKNSLIVKGKDCFYNFYGDCLKIISLLPSEENIRVAVSHACNNIKALRDPCMETLAEELLSCTLRKTTERQVDIMNNKDKFRSVEDEACWGYKSELECLKNIASACPKKSQDAFYKFMNDLVPNFCKYPKLLNILTDHLQNQRLIEASRNGPR